jgi:hypothetical protein
MSMTPLAQLLDANGIGLKDTTAGRYYTICPRCSATRSKSHQTLKCLGVTIASDGSVGRGCNHCSWTGPQKGAGGAAMLQLATYEYRDSSGETRFRKVRNLPCRSPRFWLEQPDGRGGWRKGTSGVDTDILYRIDEIATAIPVGRVILVVEGEKDADNLWRMGFAATCNAHGAGESGKKPKWRTSHSAQLRGADLVVLNDNDPAGYEHADAGCRLSFGVAQRVRRLDLKLHWPDIPKGGDVSDWLAAGHGREELAALIHTAPDYAPAHTARRGDDAGTSSADEAATYGLGAAGRQAIAKLESDGISAFLACAKADAGFAFEPEALRALSKLARTRTADYERLRVRLKADGQVRLPALEAAMTAVVGGRPSSDGLPGKPITFEEIVPWPERVDGPALLTELAETIGKYVIMDPHQRDAAALGAVFAHTHDLRDTAPIFFISSPTKRCGKTRLERVVKRLVPKPLMASSASPAFLARAIEKQRPTILIDEYDATAAGDQAMSETLRGQLNSSFDRDGAKIGKCVPLPGSGYDEREFSTWAATWIAGIKKIPETVEDRSVVLRLKRKLPGEKVARFRAKDGGELDILKRKIARFVIDNERRLRDIEPEMPEALSAAGDRAPDAWDPLVAIADVAGGAWPERARNAALALAGVGAAPVDGDIDTALLSDIKHILDACDALEPTAEQLRNNKQIAVEALDAFRRGEETATRKSRRIVGLGGEQLTNALATLVERKWPAWDKGKPMRPHQLARLLGAYGVRSQSLRDGDMVFRGYPPRQA